MRWDSGNGRRPKIFAPRLSQQECPASRVIAGIGIRSRFRCAESPAVRIAGGYPRININCIRRVGIIRDKTHGRKVMVRRSGEDICPVAGSFTLEPPAISPSQRI